MRIVTVLPLLGICGCAVLQHDPEEVGVPPHEVITQSGDTLGAVAARRYGVPEYAALIAYHNALSADALAVGTRLALPDVSEIVAGMSALKPHEETIDAILRGSARFGALVGDLREARRDTPDGVNKDVPGELNRALTLAADLLESGEAHLVGLRAAGQPYPERLHVAFQQTVDEVRLHASGRYHTRRVSVRQTERQVARIFIELLTWQRALSGKTSPDRLAYPRCRCG